LREAIRICIETFDGSLAPAAVGGSNGNLVSIVVGVFNRGLGCLRLSEERLLGSF